MTSGLTVPSTSMCTTPGKQPSCLSNTSDYCITIWSRVSRLFTFALLLLGGGAGLKLSQFTVINFMCCAALAPIKGSNSSFTTSNSTEYLLRLAGFMTIILAVPSGVTSVLFHMMRVFEVGVNVCLSTMLLGMIFMMICHQLASPNRFILQSRAYQMVQQSTLFCYASYVIKLFAIHSGTICWFDIVHIFATLLTFVCKVISSSTLVTIVSPGWTLTTNKGVISTTEVTRFP